MKSRYVFLALLVATVFAFVQNTQAQTITYLDHQKAVNRVMCEALVKCAPGKTVDDCTTQLNMLSATNPTNATTQVQKPNSDKCVAFLKTKTCDTIMEDSVGGDCMLSALQGAAATTTTTATTITAPVTTTPSITTPTPTPAPAVPDSLYAVDELVSVKWNNSWWDAKVLKAEKDRWFITYPGWDSSWDEWVTTDRIRKK